MKYSATAGCFVNLAVNDVIVNAGGGVHGHPMGAAAGGRAFRQAMEASLQGVSLRAYSQQHEELRAAIDKWGCPE